MMNLKTILVPSDFSECSAAALRYGLELARRFDARLHLLHVVQEFQEHDPGEHGQTVEVAVEPLVLPHRVASGLEKRTEALSSSSRGGGRGRFLRSCQSA